VVSATHERSRSRAVAIVVGITAAVAAIHLATPARPSSWHPVHVFAEKLYALPLLLAAAWLSVAQALLVTLAVAVLWALHVFLHWPAEEMLGLEQSGQIVSLAVIGITASLLFERWRRAHRQVLAAHQETLDGLVGALSLREHDTAEHSRRVAAYSLLIAEELGIEAASERQSLARAAVLHDIGKIGVPDRILLKGGELTEEEWSVIRRHPGLGAALLGDLPSLETARNLVLAHHERWDGHGYPRRLAGAQIPFPARLFAVADAFDALTSPRPYHGALSLADAVDRITRDSGTAFDPAIVDAFLRVPHSRLQRALEEPLVVVADSVGPLPTR